MNDYAAVFMVAGEQASTTVPFNVGEDHDRFVRTEQGHGE